MFGIFKNLFSQKDNSQLENLIKEGAFLVDVRSPDEFSSGHVEGSVNIPLGQVQNQLSKFKDKNHIIVFCQSGMRSSQAKSILEQNGFTNITNGRSWKDIKTLLAK
jgi:rhodanese-related sulfurtransferase